MDPILNRLVLRCRCHIYHFPFPFLFGLFSCRPSPPARALTAVANRSRRGLRFSADMYSARRSMDPEDPLAAAMAPPPGETLEERVLRLRKEADAKKVNDEIEERIKEDRAVWKTHKSMFKLLLLGQSESGASLSCLVPCLSPPIVSAPMSTAFFAAVCGCRFPSMHDVICRGMETYGSANAGGRTLCHGAMSASLTLFTVDGHPLGSAMLLLPVWLCFPRRMSVRSLSCSVLPPPSPLLGVGYQDNPLFGCLTPGMVGHLLHFPTTSSVCFGCRENIRDGAASENRRGGIYGYLQTPNTFSACNGVQATDPPIRRADDILH